MGKLIDSDELKLRLKNLHLLATSGYGAEEVVSKIVDEMPEGVVRCRDCIYQSKGICEMYSMDEYNMMTPEDGYCHYGERDGDGNG